MPTPVYQAQISLDHMIATPTPDPTITLPPVNDPAFLTSVCLIVGDQMGNEWAVVASLILGDNGAGATEFVASYYLASRQTKPPSFIDRDNPFTWGFAPGVVTTINESPGHGGASYLAGGLIGAQKDFDNNRMTLVTPLGTQFENLDSFDGVRTNSALNTTPLLPLGLGFRYDPAGGTHAPQDSFGQAYFFDMQQATDGVITYGVPLSADFPGYWNAANEEPWDATVFAEFFDAVNVPLGTIAPEEFGGQLLTRYFLDATISAASYPNHATYCMWRLLGGAPPSSDDIDMELSREHGIVWRGGPDITNGQAMMVQRTFDNAGTWETHTAFFDPTTSNTSPTVTWYNQHLYLTWHDGTDIRESRSLDGGVNWDVPITIPFVGSHPRRVVDRMGGGSFYFFFDTTNHLKVVATYDGGATYEGPFTIASGLTPQQIDAEFVPDGSLVASVFAAGVWQQYRSRDLAHTWV